MQTVLVVEDAGQIRTLVRITVESMGYQVLMASNGKEAWDILCDNADVDLMIVDVLMPVMDGRELVKLMRSSDDFADTPIIIMSAVMAEKDIADLLDLGASLFLPKPLAIVELRKQIANILEAD